MKRIVLLCLIIFVGVTTVSAQQEKFKAIFIYNFTKNIEWPAAYKQGDFVMGVLGSSPLTGELQTIASTKRVGTQSIVVETYSSVSQINKCHLLYLPPNRSRNLPEVLQKVQNYNTLIITDKNGLAAEGSCINFVQDGTKIMFEINPENIYAKGLKVTNSLIQLGIKVQ